MNSYIKTNWVNGGEPAITAENLNNIENGIEAATEGVTAVEQGKADISHTHPVDSAFSLTSTNPIQNVVVTRKINEIVADANNNFSNVNTQLAGKADKSDTYIKGEVNMMLSNKADKASVYTKTAVDTNFVNINDYQDNIDSIDLQLGTIEQSLSNKADKSTTDAIELSLQHKENDANKVVTVSEESTDTEYPSAKCLYNALQGCMRYENIDTSVSTSGLDNLTESNTIYDFLYNDIHEKVILLFIDSGKRAESEGQELFLNCTQIMFTQSGKILKRQSDDEGVWGVVIDVIPDVSVKVDKYQYLQDLEKIDNSINSKADESKLAAVQASFNIALGFKEANANKVSIIDPDNADDTQYPSARAVVNYINTILGKGASESD